MRLPCNAQTRHRYAHNTNNKQKQQVWWPSQTNETADERLRWKMSIESTRAENKQWIPLGNKSQTILSQNLSHVIWMQSNGYLDREHEQALKPNTCYEFIKSQRSGTLIIRQRQHPNQPRDYLIQFSYCFFQKANLVNINVDEQTRQLNESKLKCQETSTSSISANGTF